MLNNDTYQLVEILYQLHIVRNFVILLKQIINDNVSFHNKHFIESLMQIWLTQLLWNIFFF